MLFREKELSTSVYTVADLYNLSFSSPTNRSITITINPNEIKMMIDGFSYKQAYKSGNIYQYVKVIENFIPANTMMYDDMDFEPSLWF